MSRSSFAALALLSTALPGAALADIAPEDLWQVQSEMLETLGLEVSAFEVRNGDTLVISDIDVAIRLPMDFGEITVRTGPLRYRDMGDGRVSGEWDEEMPVNFFAILGPRSDIVVTGALDLRQSEKSMVASGTPDDITVESFAGLTELSLREIDVSGPGAPHNFTLAFGVAVADLSQTNRMARSEVGLISETEMRSGPSRTELTWTETTAGSEVTTVETTESTRATGRLVLPGGGIDVLRLPAALREGLALSSTSEVTGSTSRTLTLFPGQPADQQLRQTARATSAFSLDETGVEMQAGAQDATGTVLMPDFPDTPIGFDVGAVSMHLAMPLLAGRGPSQADLRFGLMEAGAEDALWDWFDPVGILPRDPLTLDLDLSATVEPLVDLLDFEAMGDQGATGDPLADVQDVTLGAFDLAALGAMLSAQGRFLLDFDDMETFDGLPRPEGSGEMTLTGVNGLLDKLLTLGAIPRDAAPGMRLGLGMFTDVTGPDELSSRIEVDPAGKVIVNGQRIR